MGASMGLTLYQRVFKYRLTMGALNLFSQTGIRQLCPYPGCIFQGFERLSHIMWSCVVAKRAWTDLYSAWTCKRPDTTTIEHAKHVIFEPTPIMFNHQHRNALLEAGINQPQALDVASKAWGICCCGAMHRLWVLRNKEKKVNKNQSVFQVAGAIRRSCQRALVAIGQRLIYSGHTHELGLGFILLAEYLSLKATISSQPEAISSRIPIRLYCDGGSRGNSGITGDRIRTIGVGTSWIDNEMAKRMVGISVHGQV